MGYQLRRLGSVVSILLLVIQQLIAQASDSVRVRVQELQSQKAEVRVSLSDGTWIQGRVVRIESDSFTLLHSAQETVVPFARVADVHKVRRGSRKALWIPAAIGGAVLVALCVAPYPIGFLCHSDPS
jgi:hypothetical protein